MRPSRGMGAIKSSKIPGAMPSKMPTKKIIHRKDDPNKVELYKKGGCVKKKSGGLLDKLSKQKLDSSRMGK